MSANSKGSKSTGTEPSGHKVPGVQIRFGEGGSDWKNSGIRQPQEESAMSPNTMSHTSRFSALATATNSSALRAFIFGILAAILLGLAAIPAQANIPVEEREALLALYQSTSGASWKSSPGWLGAWGTERNWYGVVCDPSNSTVLQVNLHGNGLSGPLPEELGNLLNLQCLVLNGNRITGSLPASLRKLAKLRKLDCSDNAIQDGMSDWMGGMSRLTILNLRNNLIEGKLPAGLGRCAYLTSMDLSSNQISGAIPPEFGDMPILQKMDLSHNALDSAIPPELSHLRNLYILQLNNNRLEGTIPFTLGDLSRVQWMDLSHNRLAGSIPTELTRMPALKTLSLNDNKLTGPILSTLGDMAALQELNLSGNTLTGGIPARLFLAPLTVLDLSNNQLTGALPIEITTAAGLRVLNLELNQLTGTLPESIGLLSNLTFLSFEHNRFAGTLPSSIGNLSGLEWLHLCDNQFEGTIPDEIGNLSNLKYLCAEQNKMAGPLTPMIMACTKLESIDLRYNGFTVNDPALAQFVTDRQPEGQSWTLNQTVPPEDAAMAASTSTTLTLAWTPITFTEGPGYYEVYGGSTSDKDMRFLGQTASKSDSGMVIRGLTPGTVYHFVVRAVSLANGDNKNTVYSAFTGEFKGITLDPPIIIGRR